MSEERLPCKTPDCPSTILPMTAALNDGLCAVCKRKKTNEEWEAHVRANSRTVDPYAGISDVVEIIRIIHAPRVHDPLVTLAPPPRSTEELYASLTAAQAARLALIANRAMREGETDFAEEIGKSLATLTDYPLDEMLEAWVEAEHFWPPVVFRGGGSRIRDKIIRSINSGDADINHALSALAWIGDPAVVTLFWEWEANPPPWRARLHVGPGIYAHDAGWEPESSKRRELFHNECLALVPTDASQGDREVRLGEPTDLSCPWCSSSLIHLIELDLTAPRFAFLGMSGKRLPVLTCERCTCYRDHVFAKILPDGTAEWHPSNVRPNWSPDPTEKSEPMPWREVPVKLAPRRAIHAVDWCMEPQASQIGGHPTWVQDSAYPKCPDCQRTMRFIGQLDNAYFPMWEGIYYAFLCAECRTTATNYQQS